MITLTRVERAKLKDLFLSEEEEIIWLHRKVRVLTSKIEKLETKNKRLKKAMCLYLQGGKNEIKRGKKNISKSEEEKISNE